jgi:hypothetical protein
MKKTIPTKELIKNWVFIDVISFKANEYRDKKHENIIIT